MWQGAVARVGHPWELTPPPGEEEGQVQKPGEKGEQGCLPWFSTSPLGGR